MSEEFTFETIVRRLNDEDADLVGRTLNIFTEAPTGDPRIMPYIEKLLYDTRLCITQIKPCYYGEIRYLAGKALAAERNVHGIEEPVRVKNTFLPMRGEEIRDLAIHSSLSLAKGGVMGWLKSLLEQGKIRTANHIFFSKGDFGLSLQNKSNTQE